MVEPIEARLARLEDLEEVRAPLADHRHHLDGKDFRADAGPFASDGEFIAGENDTIRATGPAAIFAMDIPSF